MALRIIQVDAFTDKPFSGNPAAVCVLPEPRPAEWLQSVALEMNLSETAFLTKRTDGSWDLRWFTPLVEVDLCGHATLAGAHALWEAGYLAHGEQARFHTRSGLLTAERDGAWIELDFPANPEIAMDAPAGLMEALGVRAVHFGMSGRTAADGLVEVATEAEVRAAKPDFTRLRAVDVRGVIVTARSSSPDYAIVSRFFGPAVGIDEDPVTGSAHCCLAPYWAKRLGKDDFVAHQASARGGTIRIGLRGDRVRLGGKAVTVMSGDLHV
jgi:PhzF family phenazine biosynthesis protein